MYRPHQASAATIEMTKIGGDTDFISKNGAAVITAVNI